MACELAHQLASLGEPRGRVVQCEVSLRSRPVRMLEHVSTGYVPAIDSRDGLTRTLQA